MSSNPSTIINSSAPAARILVVGAGSTGGYVGAKLLKAGRDVTFLVRPARATTLRRTGLRLGGLDDLILDPPVLTADRLDTTFDLVLLAVKATGLDAAVDDLTPAVGPSTAVIPFLNGIRHVDVLDRRFGRSALGGVIKIATTLGADGEIVRLSPFATLATGALTPPPPVDVAHLVALLDVDGIDVSASSSILADMWHKWAFIATVGVVNTLGRGSVGEIAAVDDGTAFTDCVVAEIPAVTAAAGFPLPQSELDSTAGLLRQRDSGFTSSLYRDVLAGLRTEAEPIIGDLLRRARALSVQTPLLNAAAVQLRVHEHRM
jgi:2-dehydropantoate 2-reductase